MTVFGGEDLGDVFGDRLWPEWTRLAGEEWTPAISFYEKEGKFHLEADVPGFSKDQISVEVDNGVFDHQRQKRGSPRGEGRPLFPPGDPFRVL